MIDLLAGIGVIINSVQIKKVKQSINKLQEQNILQDQKIDELARYLNLTADRVKLHNEQIYALQVEMICLHSGITLISGSHQLPFVYLLPNEHGGPLRVVWKSQSQVWSKLLYNLP